MIVNVTYMRIKVEKKYLEFILGIDADYVQFVVGNSEIEDYTNLLSGKAVYSRYFDDGITLSRPSPYGITTISLNPEIGTNGTGGEYQKRTFVFPGAEIANALYTLKSERLQIAEWTTEALEQIRKAYAPRVEVIYHDEPRHDVQGFDECIERLVRIAEFRSHGNKILIHVSYDHGFMFNGYPAYIYTIGEGREDLGGIVFNGRQYQLHG